MPVYTGAPIFIRATYQDADLGTLNPRDREDGDNARPALLGHMERNNNRAGMGGGKNR